MLFRSPGDRRTEERTTQQRPFTRAERWLARLAFVLALGAVAVVIGTGLSRPGTLAAGVAGLGLTLAALWWFLSQRGTRRWLAAGVAVAAPIGLVVAYVLMSRLWEVVVLVLLSAGSIAAAQAALLRARPPTGMPEHEAKPATRPFLIKNPQIGRAHV